jgi:seryl-tRNA synthetase
VQAAEQAQARRNAASKEIGEAKKAKDNARAEALMAEVTELKTTMPALDAAVKAADEALKKALSEIPNLPLSEVPEGADEHGNVEHHRFGEKPSYTFAPKPHYDLGEALGMMDFEAAAKLSGARFTVLKNGLARLERAIGQFFLDVHTGEHGYTEVNPPLLVKDDAMFGTAQLPKFREDQFRAVNEQKLKELTGLWPEDVASWRPETHWFEGELGPRPEDPATAASKFWSFIALKLLPNFQKASDELSSLWLIPTAEVSLTNLVRESILDEKELPMRLTALTPCFRAEAGAAGRDTRGMIRQHQFTKVELVSITTPEQSKDEHERMLSCAE